MQCYATINHCCNVNLVLTYNSRISYNIIHRPCKTRTKQSAQEKEMLDVVKILSE